ncbi:uncharacterized protein IWZ02DRAFT_446658 [Phyllosticta citriasiana]|uniref:uncharacterized protein n=1 Tax=Phyllosticta citriasiana TaxID=595635 RepID=UPI0030FDD129
MDVAYDHIQEESFPDDERPKKQDQAKEKPKQNDFNTEVQEAYKAISNSPWAARLGGLWGTVKKQGETYYETARQQSQPFVEQANQGLTGLRSTITTHTRNISTSLPQVQLPEADSSSKTTVTDKDGNTVEVNAAATANPATENAERSESLPADIVKEAEGMLSRLRFEGAKRLKDIQRAEDAADEALLKFGTNIRNFLRDAVTIAPPEDGSPADGSQSKVLFESKDADGKRIIHTTRFDAQLHVIHSNLDGFAKDPESPEWDAWTKNFDIDKKTADITKDLEKYPELRKSMEALVPDKVEYKPFWTRYYFLRHVIESEEQRRREMLKASASRVDEEEVGWDDDSDDEAEKSTANNSSPEAGLSNSKDTLKPSAAETAKGDARKLSDERSQPDSDASYDVVSGATSRGPGSPKEAKRTAAEESDEEDWE